MRVELKYSEKVRKCEVDRSRTNCSVLKNTVEICFLIIVIVVVFSSGNIYKVEVGVLLAKP